MSALCLAGAQALLWALKDDCGGSPLLEERGAQPVGAEGLPRLPPHCPLLCLGPPRQDALPSAARASLGACRMAILDQR